MKKYQKLLALLLALAMVAALAGCGSNGSRGNQSASSGGSAASTSGEGDASTETETSPDSGEPVYGGNLNCYYNSDIDAYFDPAIGDTVCWNLFSEGLWSYDETSGYAMNSDNLPTSALKGQLAESWVVDEEAATLTVTLKDNVYFQTLDEEYDYYGGRQLVASDVKWTYDRLCGLGSGYDTPLETESNWAGLLSMLVSVEAPDDLTVVFHLTSGDEVTVENFMTQFVKIGGPEWDTLTDEQKTDWHYACGTGPYMISEFEAGQRVVLTKNENYYDYDERYPENKLPYLDTITFQYIADSTNIVTQFTSGSLDWFGYRADLINDSEAAQIAASGMSYYTLDMPVAQPEYLALKCNTEPFTDIRVRQALQLAINLEEVHTAYLGLDGDVQLSALWNPNTTEWSTVDSWSDELIAEYSYDPERAKELLAEAGYPDGFEFTVVLCGTDNDYDLWTLAQEYWAAIGVTCNFETVDNFMESKTIGTDASDPRCTASTGCGAINSITAAINQTVDGGWASSLWNGDEEYAALVNGMQTVTTLDEQTDLALQADQIYAEQHWAINLTGIKTVTEYCNSRVAGIPEDSRLYSGKAAGVLFSHVWVTDGQ